MRRVVLLPGMDGTGALFDRFIAAAPPGFAMQVVPLPAVARMDQAELARRLARELRVSGGCVLVAESYSGPLAARIAAETPPGALVLCNSFIAPPRARALGLLAPAMFRAPPPRWAIRHFLAGRDAAPELVDDVRAAIARVPSAVLAARLREVMRCDAAPWLARYSGPLLYIRGENDRLVTERGPRRIQAVRPASIARIRAPHLALQAAPAACWAAIVRFIRAECRLNGA